MGEHLIKSILQPQHDKRRQGFRKGFQRSIRNNYDGWALLFKGYEYWISEQYDLINDNLWERLEDLAFGQASDSFYNAGYWDFRRLLFAQAKRRKAQKLLNQPEDVYADTKALLKEAKDLMESSSREYQSLLDKQCDNRIKAVICNSLGNIELQKEVVGFKESKTRQTRYNPHRRWKKAEEWFLTAISFSKDTKPAYAQPHFKRAWLEWKRHMNLQDAKARTPEGWRLLESCLEHANLAINLSRGKYSPPLTLMAEATHRLGVVRGPPVPFSKTEGLLKRAVRSAPYDYWVRSDLESFSKMLRKKPNEQRLIVRLAQPITATENELKEYFRNSRYRSVAGSRNQLLVLRRWSSITPLITTKEHETVGGGYLLQWDGMLVAIDPGVGFIRNLHRFGYNVCNLNAIIMTHQHIDHCADFEPMLGFFKEYSETFKSKKNFREPQVVKILLTTSGEERWKESLLAPVKNNVGRVVFEEVPIPLIPPKKMPTEEIPLAKNRIHVTPTPIFNHKDMVDEGKSREKPTGTGLVIHLRDQSGNKHILGFTSDTGCFSDRYEHISRYFRQCDTVVLNVSTVSDLKKRLDDKKSMAVKGWLNGDTPSSFYRKHLGFKGTTQFVYDLLQDGRSDRTFLLDEFGEEMVASRMALLEEIRSKIRLLDHVGELQAKRIFLSDVGTRMDLASRNLICQFGDNSCTKVAKYCYEFELDPRDPTIHHRGWDDRVLMHLCQRHAAYAKEPGLWGCFGQAGALVNN